MRVAEASFAERTGSDQQPRQRRVSTNGYRIAGSSGKPQRVVVNDEVFDHLRVISDSLNDAHGDHKAKGRPKANPSLMRAAAMSRSPPEEMGITKASMAANDAPGSPAAWGRFRVDVHTAETLARLEAIEAGQRTDWRVMLDQRNDRLRNAAHSRRRGFVPGQDEGPDGALVSESEPEEEEEARNLRLLLEAALAEELAAELAAEHAAKEAQEAIVAEAGLLEERRGVWRRYAVKRNARNAKRRAAAAAAAALQAALDAEARAEATALKLAAKAAAAEAAAAAAAEQAAKAAAARAKWQIEEAIAAAARAAAFAKMKLRVDGGGSKEDGLRAGGYAPIQRQTSQPSTPASPMSVTSSSPNSPQPPPLRSPQLRSRAMAPRSPDVAGPSPPSPPRGPAMGAVMAAMMQAKEDAKKAELKKAGKSGAGAANLMGGAPFSKPVVLAAPAANPWGVAQPPPKVAPSAPRTPPPPPPPPPASTANRPAVLHSAAATAAAAAVAAAVAAVKSPWPAPLKALSRGRSLASSPSPGAAAAATAPVPTPPPGRGSSTPQQGAHQMATARSLPGQGSAMVPTPPPGERGGGGDGHSHGHGTFGTGAGHAAGRSASPSTGYTWTPDAAPPLAAQSSSNIWSVHTAGTDLAAQSSGGTWEATNPHASTPNHHGGYGGWASGAAGAHHHHGGSGGRTSSNWVAADPAVAAAAAEHSSWSPNTAPRAAAGGGGGGGGLSSSGLSLASRSTNAVQAARSMNGRPGGHPVFANKGAVGSHSGRPAGPRPPSRSSSPGAAAAPPPPFRSSSPGNTHLGSMSRGSSPSGTNMGTLSRSGSPSNGARRSTPAVANAKAVAAVAAVTAAAAAANAAAAAAVAEAAGPTTGEGDGGAGAGDEENGSHHSSRRSSASGGGGRAAARGPNSPLFKGVSGAFDAIYGGDHFLDDPLTSGRSSHAGGGDDRAGGRGGTDSDDEAALLLMAEVGLPLGAPMIAADADGRPPGGDALADDDEGDAGGVWDGGDVAYPADSLAGAGYSSGGGAADWLSADARSAASAPLLPPGREETSSELVSSFKRRAQSQRAARISMQLGGIGGGRESSTSGGGGGSGNGAASPRSPRQTSAAQLRGSPRGTPSPRVSGSGHGAAAAGGGRTAWAPPRVNILEAEDSHPRRDGGIPLHEVDPDPLSAHGGNGSFDFMACPSPTGILGPNSWVPATAADLLLRPESSQSGVRPGSQPGPTQQQQQQAPAPRQAYFLQPSPSEVLISRYNLAGKAAPSPSLLIDGRHASRSKSQSQMHNTSSMDGRAWSPQQQHHGASADPGLRPAAAATPPERCSSELHRRRSGAGAAVLHSTVLQLGFSAAPLSPTLERVTSPSHGTRRRFTGVQSSYETLDTSPPRSASTGGYFSDAARVFGGGGGGHVGNGSSGHGGGGSHGPAPGASSPSAAASPWPFASGAFDTARIPWPLCLGDLPYLNVSDRMSCDGGNDGRSSGEDPFSAGASPGVGGGAGKGLRPSSRQQQNLKSGGGGGGGGGGNGGGAAQRGSGPTSPGPRMSISVSTLRFAGLAGAGDCSPQQRPSALMLQLPTDARSAAMGGNGLIAAPRSPIVSSSPSSQLGMLMFTRRSVTLKHFDPQFA